MLRVPCPSSPSGTELQFLESTTPCSCLETPTGSTCRSTQEMWSRGVRMILESHLLEEKDSLTVNGHFAGVVVEEGRVLFPMFSGGENMHSLKTVCFQCYLEEAITVLREMNQLIFPGDSLPDFLEVQKRDGRMFQVLLCPSEPSEHGANVANMVPSFPPINNEDDMDQFCDEDDSFTSDSEDFSSADSEFEVSAWRVLAGFTPPSLPTVERLAPPHPSANRRYRAAYILAGTNRPMSLLEMEAASAAEGYELKRQSFSSAMTTCRTMFKDDSPFLSLDGAWTLQPWASPGAILSRKWEYACEKILDI